MDKRLLFSHRPEGLASQDALWDAVHVVLTHLEPGGTEPNGARKHSLFDGRFTLDYTILPGDKGPKSPARTALIRDNEDNSWVDIYRFGHENGDVDTTVIGLPSNRRAARIAEEVIRLGQIYGSSS